MNDSLTRTAGVALALVLGSLSVDAFGQASWVFARSAYTHDPYSGERVAQYAPDAWVEPLDDPRQTVSRYSRTTTQIAGADGSRDTFIEVRSFGNTRGGFDAQRERGFDASLETLRALRPFRHNPYLFFGGTQGFNYATPGYPAAPPYGAYAPPKAGGAPQPGAQNTAVPAGAIQPAPGQPGTAYPYQPQSGAVVPVAPFFGYGGYGPYPPGYGRPSRGR